jgi:hypothetical protein
VDSCLSFSDKYVYIIAYAGGGNDRLLFDVGGRHCGGEHSGSNGGGCDGGVCDVISNVRE